jgi:hypothetical protein
MLKTASMGSQIIAELLRLSGHIPDVFLYESKSSFVMIDSEEKKETDSKDKGKKDKKSSKKDDKKTKASNQIAAQNEQA